MDNKTKVIYLYSMSSIKSPFGFVHSIYISAAAGEPMQKVPKIFAIRGKGLDGDRYASQTGFWQTASKHRETIRDVSLIRSSAIENSGFTEAETRRNIILQSDIDLVSLINIYFYIGEVLFRGVEECTPCKRPSDLSGKPNFAKAFRANGGLRAQVIKSGQICEMDPIALKDIQS